MLEFELKDRLLKTERKAFVMGIVNATPDSFWKDSRGGLERALKLIDEGADLLDIGAESTRPGSDYVSEEEELERIIPLVKEIRKHSQIPISIDTRKEVVMRQAFENGADILNDISALEDDPKMAPFASETDIPVILMHKRGLPSTMQQNGNYEDVVKEVSLYLDQRAQYAIDSGIKKERIIVDPGIGFGKDFNANCELIKHSSKLCGGKFPVLMALSRKTCVGQMTNREVQDRLYGTLACDLISVLNGCFMVRVHDVKETVDTLQVLNYII